MLWTCRAVPDGFCAVLLDAKLLLLLLDAKLPWLSFLFCSKVATALHYFDVVFSIVSGKKPAILYAKCIRISDADTSFRCVAIYSICAELGVSFTEIQKQLP